MSEVEFLDGNLNFGKIGIQAGFDPAAQLGVCPLIRK